MSKPIILSNKIQCNKCKDIIESKHVHDFVSCSCGKCSVDGGTIYLRRIGNPEDYIDLSEIISEEQDDWFNQVRDTFVWGSYGKSSKEPRKNILLKNMSNNHIEACLATQWHIKGTFVEEYFQKELEYRKLNNIYIED